ncbi:hypothetical protein ACLOJK_023971, partial [Asimina triloba]
TKRLLILGLEVQGVDDQVAAFDLLLMEIPIIRRGRLVQARTIRWLATDRKGLLLRIIRSGFAGRPCRWKPVGFGHRSAGLSFCCLGRMLGFVCLRCWPTLMGCCCPTTDAWLKMNGAGARTKAALVGTTSCPVDLWCRRMPSAARMVLMAELIGWVPPWRW